MSDKENFLTRWSRRKRETADENKQTEIPAAAGADKPAAPGDDADQTAAARAPDTNPPAPEFDITKLPTLESIGAASDIRPFLQPGVPSALRHAALRRAWVADPAIRDFVGLAEYAWDFTAPDSMPGFGEIGPDVDIKKLVAEIFGEAEPATELDAKSRADQTSPAPESEQPTRLSDKSDTTADLPAAGEPATTGQQQVAALKSAPLLQREEDIATQHNDSNESSAGIKPRRHGSATPQ